VTSPSATIGTPGPAVDISGIIEEIQSGVDTVSQAVQGIVSGINTVLGQLGQAVVGSIIAAVEQMYNFVTRAISEIGRILAYVGSPSTLTSAGDRWTNDVGAVASLVSGKSDLDKTEADDDSTHWSGEAADKYRATVPAQNSALDEVKTASDEIHKVLDGLAAGITTFWVNVGVAVISLVTAVIAALPTAATVVGAPAAAGMVSAGIIAFLTFLGEAVQALTELSNKAAENSTTLDQQLASNDVFPDGGWPRSTR
jgi:hypothetical protein